MAASLSVKKNTAIFAERRSQFVNDFVTSVNRFPWTDGRVHHRNFSFLWRFAEVGEWFKVVGGKIAEQVTSPGIDKSWDFSIAAPNEVWAEFVQPFPRSPYHHLFGLWARVPEFILDGNREVLIQNATYFNQLMRIARSVWNGTATRDLVEKPSVGSLAGIKDSISASYRHMNICGDNCRIYVEEAGQGHELLLLHTAGSDSRQFYHLFNEEVLTKQWRVVAFDLPGHGKSLPSTGWLNREYRLTTQSYVDAVLDFVNQMGLTRPVVLGCSMAGSLCLQLARDHPERFAGVIACEAAERVPGRLHDWLRHPRVDSAEFGPQWIDGLISPYSPREYRDEILWQYSQAGSGVFFGDVAFYSGEFFLSKPESIDTKNCPVFMLTGEYDYSCTPEMSRRTAEKIPGARFQEMKRLGHFPMSENPSAFLEYLMPILGELHGRMNR